MRTNFDDIIALPATGCRKIEKRVAAGANRLHLSERDSLRTLALLANPTKPNAKLLAAARGLRKRSTGMSIAGRT